MQLKQVSFRNEEYFYNTPGIQASSRIFLFKKETTNDRWTMSNIMLKSVSYIRELIYLDISSNDHSFYCPIIYTDTIHNDIFS